MHDFEAARLAVPRRREVALVAALAFAARVLEGDVADLEDLHRHAVVFVFADGFEEPGEQGGAHDLVLGRLRVREPHRRGAVVGAVEVREVLVVRAQDQRHHLRPACHGGFEPHDVRELVDGQRLRDGAGDFGEGPGEVVEAVGDRCVFHDVGFVEHVCARRRY